jgi:hypothetical protein
LSLQSHQARFASQHRTAFINDLYRFFQAW